MNNHISHDIMEVMNATSYLPSVSLIMPFETKTNLKTELAHKLKIAADKVEDQLLKNYEQQKASVVINRLKYILSNLNYDTSRKSIAIYVSPVFEKVFYLDIPLEEKIIIDATFEIRDLVYSKKEINHYLVLILSAEWTKIFRGDGCELIRLNTATPDNVNAIWNDVPSRVANFSDPSERKEIMLNKFLKYADDRLSAVLKDMPYPVFVMGTERTIGHYKKLTENNRHIIEYIHGNYEEASETSIRNVLTPHIANWKKIKELEVVHQLEIAMDAGKLVAGVEAIWKSATDRNCRLLVVEKDYVFAAQKISDAEIVPYSGIGGNSIFIKDAVDDIIEKVLISGGDVTFVSNGVLDNYGKIALVRYF